MGGRVGLSGISDEMFLLFHVDHKPLVVLVMPTTERAIARLVGIRLFLCECFHTYLYAEHLGRVTKKSRSHGKSGQPKLNKWKKLTYYLITSHHFRCVYVSPFLYVSILGPDSHGWPWKLVDCMSMLSWSLGAIPMVEHKPCGSNNVIGLLAESSMAI